MAYVKQIRWKFTWNYSMSFKNNFLLPFSDLWYACPIKILGLISLSHDWFQIICPDLLSTKMCMLWTSNISLHLCVPNNLPDRRAGWMAWWRPPCGDRCRWSRCGREASRRRKWWPPPWTSWQPATSDQINYTLAYVGQFW